MLLIRCPIWLIDSFTDVPFSGNPAGVCLVDSFPSETIMQQIAFEVHWSETAFIHRVEKSDNRYRIRWFSPLDEAPICGHATLAAMHFLCETGAVPGDSVIFESRAGELRATKKQNKITMNFPVFPITNCTDRQEICFLSKILQTQDILEVYRDSLIYIVVLASEQAVLNCVPDLELMKTADCRAIAITAVSNTRQLGGKEARESPTKKNDEQNNGYDGYDFVSRYFAPKVGIPEDPVCGSSYCRLAPLWAKILGQKEMRARQLSNRGGYIDLLYDEEANSVAIAGQAKTVLKGEIYV